MTVQVTTNPPGTAATYSYDSTSGAPLVPTGPGTLQFQDIAPDGSLGPIWSADDLTVLGTEDAGPRVRFPDGTEIVLAGAPQQLASLLGEIAPAAGPDGTGSGDAGDEQDAGGSSQAVQDPNVQQLGTDFGSGDGGTGPGGLDGKPLLPLDDSDPNLILTAGPAAPTTPTGAAAGPTGPVFVIPAASLDGTNGYTFKGIAARDLSGLPVSSAGDVDGDGFEDLLIGAFRADPGGDVEGESYLVFGASLAALDVADGAADGMIELSNLDGASGFVFNGIGRHGRTGIAVSSAGDVDGDGFDDLIIGADRAHPGGIARVGESYLVFGGTAKLQALDGNGDGVIALSDLDGINGLAFRGIDLEDQSGRAVSSAGDVNGDGFDDLIVGAFRGDQSAGDSQEGETYLVFGGAANLLALDQANGAIDGAITFASLDGTTGYIFKGIDPGDHSGWSVSSAGDVNGDGFDDLIIGANRADPGTGREGESYLVFGGTAKLAALDADDGMADGMIELSKLDGTNGFIFEGIDEGDLSGLSVSSAGDVNGDGFDDLIIGARGDDATREGESYLVFGGQANLQALDGNGDGTIELVNLDGTTGFIFKGIDEDNSLGASVSSAGDVNGDGFDDLLIGARGDGITREGESYLVFGDQANLQALDGLDGITDGMIGLDNVGAGNGLVIVGIDPGDAAGISVSSAGDVNGDGFDDLLVGADGADPNGRTLAGETYLIFGGDFTGSVEILADGGGQSLVGDANANVINAGNGNDTINGNGGADVLNGGAGDDRLVVGDDSFFRIDGGGGEDVLAFALAAARDFGSFQRTAIQDIEGLDFTNGGNDTVTLGLDDVLALGVRNIDFQGEAGLDNVLSITGETGDQVNLAASDGWSDPGTPGTGSAAGFTIYTVEGVTLAIETEVMVQFT